MNIILLPKNLLYVPEHENYQKKEFLLSKEDIKSHEPLAWPKTWIDGALDWKHDNYVLILTAIRDTKNKGKIVVQMEDHNRGGLWVFCKKGKTKKAWKEMQFVCELRWKTLPAFWDAPSFVRLVKQKVQDSINEHREREAEQHALVDKYLGFQNLFPTPLT